MYEHAFCNWRHLPANQLNHLILSDLLFYLRAFFFQSEFLLISYIKQSDPVSSRSFLGYFCMCMATGLLFSEALCQEVRISILLM